MTYEQRQNYITTGFIILSLLLHLLLLLVPKNRLFPKESVPPPVYVEVRPSQERERELDLPIRKELEKPRQKPAKRLAEKDQVVEKEMAPEGKDTEDRQSVARTPAPAPKPRPQTTAKPQETVDAVPKQAPAQTTPVTPEGWRKPASKPAPSVPDLATLTQISPSTLAQIESDWRQKYREDVERGDTVWMDTQQDLLISFMRRFRDNIYGVWNYPAAAINRQQQGTCLVRITVNRLGDVVDVILLESSGYRNLDDEVIRAVKKGATYGPLPRSYPNEDLKIMAFFQYHLSGVAKKYRRRPGDIY
jgi:protein TonB